MKIKEIRLLTQDIEAARDFYSRRLGLPVLSESQDSVTFEVGQSCLSFMNSDIIPEPYYHFAFNINPNKLSNSINWLNEKGVLINKVKNNEVVNSESWNSDSIYFYDAMGNIVEFIARHPIKDERSKGFSYSDILNISEIGLSTNDVPTLM